MGIGAGIRYLYSILRSDPSDTFKREVMVEADRSLPAFLVKFLLPSLISE
jgi:hypothetical protein